MNNAKIDDDINHEAILEGIPIRVDGSFCRWLPLYTVVASGICTFRFLRVVHC